MAIFNSQEIPEKVNGVQIEATCHQLGLSELPSALKTLYSKRFADTIKTRIKKYLDPHKYLGVANFRLYKVVPQKVYILDPSITDNDIRLEVNLP